MNSAANPVEDVSNGPNVGDGEQLTTDDVFMLLKNERRRRILSILRETPETTLSDLAEAIAAMEHDTEPERLTSSQRKRVYVSLYQCHLPKLDEHGVIAFDSSRGDVVRAAGAEQLEPYLEDAADENGVGVVPVCGCLLGLVALVGVAVPALGPAAVWGGLAAAGLVASSGGIVARDVLGE